CNVILAIPAIICGIIALVKISKSQGQLKGNGFAIAGIAVPVVVTVVITPMLLAILMPALSQVKRVAQKEVCSVNIKGLSIAMIVYTNDYDEILPTEHWCDFLIEEADVSPKSLVCPASDAVEGECCYAINKYIAGLKMSDLPVDVVLIFETDIGLEPGPRNTPIRARRHYEFFREEIERYNSSSEIYYDESSLVYGDRFNQYGGPEDVAFRHRKDGKPACNVVYADGRVETVTEDRMAELKWAVE
ncbi:MAG: DUF4190 domain-containing protein, partial [Planctomycetota bacterium]